MTVFLLVFDKGKLTSLKLLSSCDFNDIQFITIYSSITCNNLYNKLTTPDLRPSKNHQLGQISGIVQVRSLSNVTFLYATFYQVLEGFASMCVGTGYHGINSFQYLRQTTSENVMDIHGIEVIWQIVCTLKSDIVIAALLV